MSGLCQSRRNVQYVLSLALVGCLLAAPSGLLAADDTGAEYQAAVEARAVKAEQSGDAIQMIEAAYALYPFDAQKGAEKSRTTTLLNKAVDVTLTKKDRVLAGKVLDLSSPFSGQIAAEKRNHLEELALGKSIADQVNQEAKDVAPNLKKYGPDLGDPEIKGRGDAEKDIAETLGMAVLVFCRPSAPLADTQPTMTSYKYDIPKPGRVTLTVNLRWHGMWTNDPYDAKVTIRVMTTDGFEILNIQESDTCLVPCGSRSKLPELVEILNSQLAKLTK